MEDKNIIEAALMLQLCDKLASVESDMKRLTAELECHQRIRKLESEAKDERQHNRELNEMLDRMERVASIFSYPPKKWWQFWK